MISRIKSATRAPFVNGDHMRVSDQPARGISDGLSLTVGVDIVPVERMAKLSERGEALEGRVFTAAELERCSERGQRDECLAARFAAKEAVMKAFGKGLADGIRFAHVEVTAGEGGRPEVVLHGALSDLASERGLQGIELSLSHAGGMAVAFAIAVWRAG
jgi:holo-[acyl-carrier protein] synthase